MNVSSTLGTNEFNKQTDGLPQIRVSNKMTNKKFMCAMKFFLFCFVLMWIRRDLQVKGKKIQVTNAGIKIENVVTYWLLRNTLTHKDAWSDTGKTHTHTYSRTHTHLDTESECPLRLNATRRQSIAGAELQYCSPSWLSNTHIHTLAIRSMAVRCVHGYRASTPSLMATKEPWELVCDWLTDCFKDTRII